MKRNSIIPNVKSYLRGVLLFVLAFSMVLFPQGVQAQTLSFSAEINKEFSPISITSGGISRLSVTIFNPNLFPMSNAAWADNLVGVQPGISIANPVNLTNTCNGTVIAPANGTSLSLSGGSVPAQVGSTPGSCTVSIDVTSTTPGNLINTIPANGLSGTGGDGTITNTTPASATLRVGTVQSPLIQKLFTPNTMWVGETSQLTLAIYNADPNVALTQTTVTDNLPANVVLANPVSATTNSCGASATLTAISGSGSFTLNNAVVAPGSVCLITVNVTSTTPGAYVNAIPVGAVQTDQGVTNQGPALAPLNIQGVGLAKSFSPENFEAGSTTTLTITVQNPTSTPLTGVNLSDVLPGTVLTVVPGSANTTCGGTASTTLPRTVTLTGGTVPAGTTTTPGTCTITVQVTAPANATAESFLNTIPAGAMTTTQGITNILPATAPVTIYSTGAGVGAQKTFTPDTIQPGENSLLTITVTAPADSNLTNFSIVDNLPANVTISNSSPSSLSASCGPSAVLTAVTGSSSVSLTNGAILAGATCQINVYVTSTVAGVYTNTINPANVSNNEGQTLPGPITTDLTVQATSDFSVTKEFTPDVVGPNGISLLTISLTNTNSSPLINVSLLDTFPGDAVNGVVVAPVPNATTTCGSGVITAVPGAQSISMAGGTIPAQVGAIPGLCTITVNVQGRGAGSGFNTIPVVNVSGTIQGTSTVINPVADAVAPFTITDLSIGVVKGFNPLTVFGGSASTMSVQLVNPNNADLVGIAFTDNMPAGMIVANPVNPSVGTCGGAISATPDDGFFSFSGGSLAPFESCTLTLSITMTVNGNLTNTILANAVTTTNGARNPQPAEASLTNLPGASVSKSFSPNPINTGEYSLLTITITNTGNIPLTGMGLSDTLPGLLPTGLMIAGASAPAPVNNCGGTLTAVTGSQNIQLTGGSVDASSSCTIVVAVTSNVPGSYQNIIPTGSLSTSEGATNNSPATDTLVVLSAATASLGDLVWNDLNADGIQDGSETGIDGVTVNLYSSTGTLIATTTTSGGGLYLFDNLTPGDYYVEFIPPTGYVLSPQDQGGNDATDSDANTTTGITATTTLVAGENDLTWDAGVYQPASLGDRVWNDLDADGIQDGSETGIDGVTVNLYSSTGTLVATTTTSGGGLYLFDNLTPGDYYVEFIPPTGYVLSPQDQGGNDAADSDANTTTGITATTTLVAGENDLTWDAGVFQQPLASLGDRVWNDLDADGIQDGSETGIDGVTVNLYSSTGALVATTTTSGGGLYLFDNLTPGDYYVEFIPPTGYVLSPQDQGGNDATDSDANTTTGITATTTLVAGENDLTWDAGVYQPASLGDRVWNDLDADGIQDGSETGIDGVTVNLYSSTGTLVATTTTSGGGLYLFDNLTPGDYYVEFIPPTGYVLSSQNQGGDDAADSDANTTTGVTATTTLTSGENDLTWDAGVHQPLASLGNFVWNDLDADGIQDSGEAGINGVTVRLHASDGTVIATTTTTNGGQYLFSNLIPGDYYVEFVAPTGYLFSPQNQGGDDTADSDANTTTGVTATTTLIAGENDLTWDAGVFQQQNASSANKTITDTNLDATTGTNVAIGEIVTYQVSVVVPRGSFTNFQLVDTMERGLAFVGCDSIDSTGLTTDVVGSFTQICANPTADNTGQPVDVDRIVTFNFGTLSNNGQSDATLTVTYRAIVLNVGTNEDGTTLNNSAAFSWTGGSTTPAQVNVTIVEPDLQIEKTANVNFIANGSEATFTLTISHTTNSSTDAFDVVVTDILPTGLDYIAGSIDCTIGAQDPVECTFDNSNPAQPTIRARWDVFTRNGGNGQVRFRVIGNASIPANGSVTNIANVEWSSMPGDQTTPTSFSNPANIFATERYYDPADPQDLINVYDDSDTFTLTRLGSGGGGGGGGTTSNPRPPVVAGAFLIPVTGFAPNQVTVLDRASQQAYSPTGLTIEIPVINVKAGISGVALKDGNWDVSWLQDQAGWLEGTAYPTWEGNSVLTAHSVNKDGKAGVFSRLKSVKSGEYIFVYNNGYRYTYKVVSNTAVKPNDISVLAHEEKPYLTLVTCDNYDEKSGTYLNRIVVRALLVDVSRIK
ncbi:MAG: sortase [Anaerolineales bacterium]|nr:sortase [Anaerolineales bacterium]